MNERIILEHSNCLEFISCEKVHGLTHFPLNLISVFFCDHIFSKTTMGTDSNTCPIIYTVLVIVGGLVLFSGSLYCCIYNWPVSVNGHLRQCEQAFMCPDYSVRYNEVQYKGNSPLIATLVEGLPGRANTGKTVLYNHDGNNVSKSAPFSQTYSLVEGSSLQWEMANSLSPVTISVYYERREGCKQSGDCIKYVEEEGVISHSGKIQAKVTGKYTIRITSNKTESTQINKLSVNINYWHYLIEDEAIHNKTEPWTFILPDNLEQTSCVFVELPCNETLSPEKQLVGEHYQLKAFINKDYFLTLSIFTAIVSGLLIIAGIVSLVYIILQ